LTERGLNDRAFKLGRGSVLRVKTTVSYWLHDDEDSDAAVAVGRILDVLRCHSWLGKFSARYY